MVDRTDQAGLVSQLVKLDVALHRRYRILAKIRRVVDITIASVAADYNPLRLGASDQIAAGLSLNALIVQIDFEKERLPERSRP